MADRDDGKRVSKESLLLIYLDDVKLTTMLADVQISITASL